MTRAKDIIRNLIELTKIGKNKCGILKVPQQNWYELTYDEKSIIHEIIGKYDMTMVFKNNIVYITYNNIVRI